MSQNMKNIVSHSTELDMYTSVLNSFLEEWRKVKRKEPTYTEEQLAIEKNLLKKKAPSCKGEEETKIAIFEINRKLDKFFSLSNSLNSIESFFRRDLIGQDEYRLMLGKDNLAELEEFAEFLKLNADQDYKEFIDWLKAEIKRIEKTKRGKSFEKANILAAEKKSRKVFSNLVGKIRPERKK